MTLSYSLLTQFTSPWNGKIDIYRQLEIFAKSLGWYPSDILEEKQNNDIAVGHLLVEHGLDNQAVITFLNGQNLFTDLSNLQKNELLKLSYNNLIDLHIPVDKKNIYGINNRISGDNLIYKEPIKDKFENLRSDFLFELLEDKKYKASYNAVDIALIKTIAYWKQRISLELSSKVKNEELSNLFNAIILSRVIEDVQKKKGQQDKASLIALLIQNLSSKGIAGVFEIFLTEAGVKKFPSDIIDQNKLTVFNSLPNSTITALFSDFYSNSHAPFQYDFSIISMHSLSKIYEKYVSLLKNEKTDQENLFGYIEQIEVANKASGSYYTPQFIGRFFGRYIERNIPDFKNKGLKIVEPAVGSGVFLRAYLEKLAETKDLWNPDFIKSGFDNILGIDINETACHAAKLSLSVLYFTLTGKLPSKKLNIITGSSLKILANKKNSADILIANPPFVPYNQLTDEERNEIRDVLGDLTTGKPDKYLPFIKIAVDTLKPNGYGFFVLPNTFLVSATAKTMRDYLFANTYVRCIVDLSGINVFEDVGVYTILLIFQKTNLAELEKASLYGSRPLAVIAKINDKVGMALYDTLTQSPAENNFYNVYEVPQEFFKAETWFLLPPTEFKLINRLDKFKKLSDFADIRTGFTSGNDAFIIDRKDIPTQEQNLYLPYLADKEMQSYIVPKNSNKLFFNPFLSKEKVTEKTLKEKYRITYSRLKSKYKELSTRAEVKAGKCDWWRPNRPRTPEFMLIPKIMTPHLVITPKFSLDIDGKYGVARSPFICLKDRLSKEDKNGGVDKIDLLCYMAGVLNSNVCFWYLLNHAPKYSMGFAMIEAKYLESLPIPDPETSDPHLVSQIIRTVREIITVKGNIEKKLVLDKKIDDLVTSLYNLNQDEKKFLRLSNPNAS